MIMDADEIADNEIEDNMIACLPLLEVLELGLAGDMQPIPRCGALLRIGRACGWITGGAEPATLPVITDGGRAVIVESSQWT